MSKSTKTTKATKSTNNTESTKVTKNAKDAKSAKETKSMKNTKVTESTENNVSRETNNATTKQTAKERKQAEKEKQEQERLTNKANLVSVMFKALEENGLVSYHWQGNMPNLMAVRAGKKTAAEIYLGKKDYRINVRQTVFDAAGIDGYVTIKNYYLPACKKNIPLTDTKTAVKVIEKIADLYSEFIPTNAEAE